jgi:hypothetical protein
MIISFTNFKLEKLEGELVGLFYQNG